MWENIVEEKMARSLCKHEYVDCALLLFRDIYVKELHSA